MENLRNNNTASLSGVQADDLPITSGGWRHSDLRRVWCHNLPDVGVECWMRRRSWGASSTDSQADVSLMTYWTAYCGHRYSSRNLPVLMMVTIRPGILLDSSHMSRSLIARWMLVGISQQCSQGWLSWLNYWNPDGKW